MVCHFKFAAGKTCFKAGFGELLCSDWKIHAAAQAAQEKYERKILMCPEIRRQMSNCDKQYRVNRNYYKQFFM